MLHSNYKKGQITVFHSDMCGSAELSEFTSDMIKVSGLSDPVYYFNRIKVPPEEEGKGFGRELMIEVCRIADEEGITILNELNPYGKRDMNRLKDFFQASGFEDFKDAHPLTVTMVRRPKE